MICHENPTQPNLPASVEKLSAPPKVLLREGTAGLEEGQKREQVQKKKTHPRRIHGHSWQNGKRTPTYQSWQAMKERCLNPKAIYFHCYGGRGIKVCKRWREFYNFLADVGIRPNGTTLGRINNNGDYEPGNVRWETTKEQNRNKRDNRMVMCFNRLMCAKDAAQLCGLNYNSLMGVIRRKKGIIPDVSEIVVIPHKKLLPNQIDEIIKSSLSFTSLGIKFGIDRRTVRKIKTRSRE